MESNPSGEDSSRRDLLRYAGLVGVVGFTGFTGLNLGSKPAIATPTGSPSISDGIFAGGHQVSSYDIEYQNLDTSSDIKITYIFTDSSNTETISTHSVSLSGEPKSGTVSTGSHSVTVPSGDIQLGIELSHPSLSSKISTNPSSVSTVYPDVIDASGGTTVLDKTIGGQDYRIHAFENVGNDTFVVNRAPSDATVDVLVVGGGGGGVRHSGGGGAGGVAFANNLSITHRNYTIEVGDGGPGSQRGDFNRNENNGDDSFFDENGSSEIRAIGGGGAGADTALTGGDGGSGGGAHGGGSPGNRGNALQPGTNNNAQDFGNDGRDATRIHSGAGGAGQPPPNLKDGGDGVDFSNEFGASFGESGFFGGGGGAGNQIDEDSSNAGGIGGSGGGGDGGDDGQNGQNGQQNTGGGGGGSAKNRGDGGEGGSGIVLIRYKI